MRRFLLLMATSAIALAMVVPAFAQRDTGQEPASQTVTVTGVIEKPEVTSYMYGTHAITDEASGTRYALRSEEEGLLDGYTDRRVTVYGTSVSDYENGAIEGGPPLLDVARVDSADPSDPENPELGVDLNGDGVVDEADGEFAATVSDAAKSAVDKADQTVLPATGGPPPLPGTKIDSGSSPTSGT